MLLNTAIVKPGVATNPLPIAHTTNAKVTIPTYQLGDKKVKLIRMIPIAGNSGPAINILYRHIFEAFSPKRIIAIAMKTYGTVTKPVCFAHTKLFLSVTIEDDCGTYPSVKHKIIDC